MPRAIDLCRCYDLAVSQEVRYRRARASEKLETYAFVFAWPLVFTLPYGLWTWVLAFTPDLLVWAARYVWRARAATVATVRRSGSGVVLVDAQGERLEGFEDSDVDAVTSIIDPKKQTIDLRIDRKAGRALLFEVRGDDDVAAVAKRLGIDAGRARSRYRGASLALPRLALPFCVMTACMLYGWFGSPEHSTAVWLLFVNRYLFLPTIVLINVPTAIDIGRDGVAWRWLFVRRYVAFKMVLSMEALPANAQGPKIGGMRITQRNGTRSLLPLGKHAANAATLLLEGFAESKRPAAPVLVEDWLTPTKDESAAAWIQRLRAKSAAGGTYRGTDIRHLWPLAEDPATAQSMRCGMLLVLATTEEARERVRAVATQVVDPEVRAVLEAIANGANDEQIAKPLDQILRTEWK